MISHRRSTLPAFLFVFAGAFSLGAPAERAAVPARPNVVLILADDMGYGDVSLNNPHARTKTPHIDALAGSGLRFTEAHAGGATCIPSRYALLTGRSFFRSPMYRVSAARLGGVGYFPPLIEEGRDTIASMMKRAGYSTAIIGKWHLGMDWERKDPGKPAGLLEPDTASRYTNTDFGRGAKNGPNSRGFDHSFIIASSASDPPFMFIENDTVLDPDVVLIPDIYPTRLADTVLDWDLKYVNAPGDVYWHRGVIFKNGEISKSFRIEQGADRMLEEATDYLHERAREAARNPFFLYLPLTGPHTPWMPTENFRGRSGMGTYGDWVLQMDHAVGTIVRSLRELNLEENTLLIFSSDNGAHWGEEDVQRTAHQANFPRRGQKADIWDGGHHVPLVVRWPARIRSPGAYAHSVSLNDIFATLADLVRQPLATGAAEDSVSFLSVLEGDHRTPVRDDILYEAGGGPAIVKDGWKYISVLGSAGFTSPTLVKPAANGPKGQLYNLAEDSWERVNLFFSRPEKADELSKLLERQVKQGFSAPRLERRQ